MHIKDYEMTDINQAEAKAIMAARQMACATIHKLHQELSEEEELSDCAADKLKDCVKTLLYSKEMRK